MVRTATRTPQRCSTRTRTAARLHSANGSPNASGVCWQISARISVSCAACSRAPVPGSGPRGLAAKPAMPAAATRWQMLNTPVWVNPVCAAIAP